jgi:hypothetical protein
VPKLPESGPPDKASALGGIGVPVRVAVTEEAPAPESVTVRVAVSFPAVAGITLGEKTTFSWQEEVAPPAIAVTQELLLMLKSAAFAPLRTAVGMPLGRSPELVT